eukprot:jgi/Tetstr1/421987/TSEL_001232.t1
MSSSRRDGSQGKAWHHALITEMAAEELTMEPRAGLFRPERREGGAVNNFFKDLGREPMALGDLVGRLRKGLVASHVTLHLMRAPVPAHVVLKALTVAKALRLELGITWGMDPGTVVRVELFRANMGATTTMYVICVMMRKIKYFCGWAMESRLVPD